jgi:hypothetical protein
LSGECASLGSLSGGMAMRRRAFIAALGGAAAWPVVGQAQQQSVRNPRIGFLYGGVTEALALRANAFMEGVRGAERRTPKP